MLRLLLFVCLTVFSLEPVSAQADSLPGGFDIYECYDRFRLKDSWAKVIDYMNSAEHAQAINIKSIVEETGDYPFAYVKQENRKTIDSILQLNYVKQLFPSDIDFVWSTAIEKRYSGDHFSLYAIKKPDLRGVITEKDLVSATAGYSKVNELHTITLKMTTAGKQRWKEITERSIGNVLVMVVDNKVLSAPRVYMAITEGTTEISGTFTKEEAEELASRINSQINKE